MDKPQTDCLFETGFEEVHIVGISDVRDSNGNSIVNNKIATLPSPPTVPTDLSELKSDEEHRTVTDKEKEEWNNKYYKPINGIKLTDLEESIQKSLEKADNSMPADTLIPSKTSELENDSNFINEHQSLAAYRTAMEQDEIDAKLVTKTEFEEKLATLPELITLTVVVLTDQGTEPNTEVIVGEAGVVNPTTYEYPGSEIKLTLFKNREYKISFKNLDNYLTPDIIIRTFDSNTTIMATYTFVPNLVSFEADDWNTIKWAGIHGTAKEDENGVKAWYVGDKKCYQIGDKKSIPLNLDGRSAIYYLTIIDFSHDKYSNDGLAPFTFALLPLSKLQISFDTTSNVWELSNIRNYLNTSIFNLLPTELKQIIQTVKKLTSNADGSDSITTLDKLFLLSTAEIGFSSTGISDKEGYAYPYYSTNDKRKQPIAGEGISSSYGYWLRSPITPDNKMLLCVSSNGGLDFASSLNINKNFIFAFCI